MGADYFYISISLLKTPSDLGIKIKNMNVLNLIGFIFSSIIGIHQKILISTYNLYHNFSIPGSYIHF